MIFFKSLEDLFLNSSVDNQFVKASYPATFSNCSKDKSNYSAIFVNISISVFLTFQEEYFVGNFCQKLLIFKEFYGKIW